MSNEGYCGYVVIVGRPNVGKSTLLNQLIGHKLSITSQRPQTTRHRLLGIKTENNTQIVYVDTPGLHQHKHNAMNRYLNHTALNSVEGVDVIIWLVEALCWTAEDDYILTLLRTSKVPIILGINKVDKVSKKTALLPYLQEVANKFMFADIFPISAHKGDNLAELETKIIHFLPFSTLLFPDDYFTNCTERFLSAEIIREKLMRHLGAEVPYSLTVQIEYFKKQDNLTHISAIIWVARQGQKAIVIGKQGKILKMIGEIARKEIEILLGHKIFLQLWVKVKEGWCDNEQALQHLGYSDH